MARPKRGTSFNERLRACMTLQDLDDVCREVLAAAKDRSSEKQWVAAVGFVSAAFTGHSPDVDYTKPLEERLRTLNEAAHAAVSEGDSPKPILDLIHAEGLAQDAIAKSKTSGDGEGQSIMLVLGDNTSATLTAK